MRRFHLFVSFLVIFFISFRSEAQVTLNFGELVNFELATTNEVDSFTFDFDGAPGEKIIFRLIEQTGSTIQPQITFLDPTGNAIYDSWSQGPTVEISPNLNLTGTYKIYVKTFGGEETGAYALLLQRSIDPPGAVPISITGEPFFDELETMGEVNTYTLDFDGQVGEKVMFRLFEKTPSDIQPQLLLFDPSGEILINTWSQSAVESWIDMPSKGTYVLWVTTLYGSLTGEYSLYMQNSVQPPNAHEISEYGVFMVDTVKTIGENLTYSYNYNGQVGEKVIFRIYEKSPSDIQPQVVMFDPAGTVLINTWGQQGVDQTISMPSTGNYTFWVTTLNGATTGMFYFYMQRSIESSRAVLVNESDTFIDAFTFVGDLHTYELNIPSGIGENVTVSMSEKAPSDLQPQLTIFSPSGTQLASNWGQASVELIVQVTEPGSYTVWVDNLNNNLLGSYELTVDLPEPSLSEAPNLYRIEDIPDDQGGYVNVYFTRSTHDTDAPSQDKIQSTESYTVEINDGSGWTAAATTVAYGQDYYTVLVPTTRDSSSESSGVIDFQIIAGMEEGSFISNSMTGYSVDNLRPAAPSELIAVPLAGPVVSMQWSPVPDEDFNHYRIMRKQGDASYKAIASVTDTVYSDQDVMVDQSYSYAVVAVDHAGNASDFSNIVPVSVTSIISDNQTPTAFGLHQNYPNPFNPVTAIRYSLAAASEVELSIYNAAGEKIDDLIRETQQAGIQTVQWNAGALPSGVYFCRLKAISRFGVVNLTRKMVLLK